METHNKAVNSDAFFVRFAHYKCAGYGWRYVTKSREHNGFNTDH